jgi:hypothetical protein
VATKARLRRFIAVKETAMRAYARSAFLACTLIGAQPGLAHAGLFDMLFGGQQEAPSYAAPSYNEPPSYGGPTAGQRYLQSRPFERMRRKPAVAAVTIKEDHAAMKQAAQTTDLMHDKTLRPGDVVMTDKGVRVFDGEKGSRHDGDDFVKISDAQGMSKEVRSTLDAINAHRSQPTWQVGEAELPLQTGRSAAGGNAPARTSTDRDGHTIRVVGP